MQSGLLRLEVTASGGYCVWRLLRLEVTASGGYCVWRLLRLEVTASGGYCVWKSHRDRNRHSSSISNSLMHDHWYCPPLVKACCARTVSSLAMASSCLRCLRRHRAMLVLSCSSIPAPASAPAAAIMAVTSVLFRESSSPAGSASCACHVYKKTTYAFVRGTLARGNTRCVKDYKTAHAKGRRETARQRLPLVQKHVAFMAFMLMQFYVWGSIETSHQRINRAPPGKHTHVAASQRNTCRVGCAPQNVALEVVQQLVRIDRQLLGSCGGHECRAHACLRTLGINISIGVGTGVGIGIGASIHVGIGLGAGSGIGAVVGILIAFAFRYRPDAPRRAHGLPLVRAAPSTALPTTEGSCRLTIVQRLLPRAQLHLVRCSVQRDRERRCHCGFARQVDVPLLEFKRLKRVAILACQAKRRDLGGGGSQSV
eukprot:349867-Chlamydomonas_euryale.AAC.3